MVESPYSGISLKTVSPTIRDLTYMVGGKEVLWQHAFLSGDGKTLCLVNRGVTPQGITVENVSVFTKQ